MNSPTPRCPRGFTLVELLATISILFLIMVMAGSLTSYVLSGSKGAQRRSESDTLARAFFARINYDLETLVANTNAPLIAIPSTLPATTTINPSIGFVCASRADSVSGAVNSPITGTAVSPHCAVIYYQVGTPANDPVLSMLRGSEPIYWNATDNPPYPYTTSGALASASNAMTGQGATGFDLIPMGAGIIRVTYVLTLSGGTTIPLNTSATGFPLLSAFAPNPSSPPFASGVVAIDSTKVRAITIGVAAFDTATMRILTSTQVQNLAAAIPEPAAGQKPLDLWSVQNSAIAAVLATLPVPARTNLHFYQQTVLLQ